MVTNTDNWRLDVDIHGSPERAGLAGVINLKAKLASKYVEEFLHPLPFPDERHIRAVFP